MTKLLALVGSIVGSYIGWFVGRPVGLMTAFMLSMVGTGFGIWAGRRAADSLLG